jgi:nucleoside-diphosphate-sugar epimerase
MHRVMIVGSNGRIGRAISLALAGRDEYEVLAVSGPSGSRDSSVVSLDISDRSRTEQLVNELRPNSIVHLGGVSGTDCEDDPARAIAINVQGTVNLATSAKNAGVQRLVFPSTAGVYGDSYSEPVTESGPLAPNSLYADTKLQAEEKLRELASPASSAAILRIFNVYGPGMHQSLVERLRRSTTAAPVSLWGWDEFVRDYSHVSDVAQLIIGSLTLALDTSAVTVNVGSGDPTPNSELVRLMRTRGEVSYDLRGTVASYSSANVAYARSLFGMVPRPLSDRLLTEE